MALAIRMGTSSRRRSRAPKSRDRHAINARKPQIRWRGDIPAGGRVTALLLLAVLIGCLWWLLGTDLFVVGTVTIHGEQRVPTEQLVDSSQARGQNAFFLNTTAVRRAVSSSSPFIKEAYLEHPWPGELTISVAERTAQYWWKTGDSVYEVAEDGIALAETASLTVTPTLVDLNHEPIAPASRVDIQALQSAAWIRVELPKAAGVEIATLAWSSSAGFVVTCTDGSQLILGHSDQLPRKVEVAATLLAQLRTNRESFAVIDLRQPNRPTYR